MANGRVTTGFSLPYVAVYSATGNTVSYSSGQILARGVSVSLDVESSDDNTFYADNQAAETAPGTFNSGSITLTVDGLLAAARRLIFGLPEAGSDGFVAYGDNANPPYVGIGYITRYMSGGVESYGATVIPKARFAYDGGEAATQEEEIEWQTQELTATILRDDSANHVWKYVSDTVYSTEAEAEAALKTKLGI